MIKSIAVAFTLAVAIVVPTAGAGALPHIWSHRYGDQNEDQMRAIAVGTDGSVYVAGIFRGTINLGGDVLTSAGGYDIFIAKYTPGGVHVWSRRFGDAQHQYVGGLVVTSIGEPIMAGSFYGSVNFGGTNHVSAGGTDIYLVRFDTYGGIGLSHSYGDAQDQYAHGLTLDGSDMVIMTGAFAGTVDFGGPLLTSAGGYDIFLFKHAPSPGAHIWSKRFGDASDQYGYAVAGNIDGRIALTGRVDGSVNFGGGVINSTGGGDMCVAVFQSGGAHDWSRLYGNTGLQAGYGIRFDRRDYGVVVTGIFEGTCSVGGGNLISAGLVDVFYARYTVAGAHQWSRRFGNTASDAVRGLAVGLGGVIVLTGYFEGTVDFGGGGLTSAGGSDIYIATYDDSGDHLFSQRAGDALRQEGQAVAGTPGEEVVACGQFEGTIDFGGDPLTSHGGLDVYVAKLGPTTSRVEEQGLEARLQLHAGPVPSRAGVTITYGVPRSGPVQLAIHEVGGRLVELLVDEEMPAGVHEAIWRRDSRGGAIRTGVYFVRLHSPWGSGKGKVLILE
ncbi:MAG: hypothetical protein JXA57_13185 [Armatimonadetes bacterium]|nr:hypothetical protein [Armatimonadota bacterium]